jgi:hypothetical protein
VVALQRAGCLLHVVRHDRCNHFSTPQSALPPWRSGQVNAENRVRSNNSTSGLMAMPQGITQPLMLTTGQAGAACATFVFDLGPGAALRSAHSTARPCALLFGLSDGCTEDGRRHGTAWASGYHADF